MFQCLADSPDKSVAQMPCINIGPNMRNFLSCGCHDIDSHIFEIRICKQIPELEQIKSCQYSYAITSRLLPEKVWLLFVFDFKSKNLFTLNFSFIDQHFRYFFVSTLGQQCFFIFYSIMFHYASGWSH